MARVRGLVVGLCLAAMAMPVLAAEPTLEELKQKFQETVAASRMPIVVKGERLTGPGAEFLKARAGESQFVLLGEEHGVATIADTVRAMFADLQPLGYRTFAIEVDPWMTAKLEAMLRAGGTKELGKFLTATPERRFAIPFYNWTAEAALADAVVRARGDATPALWGFDQLFIGAAGHLLGDVAAGASNAEAKALAQSLADQAKGKLDFLGRVDLGELQKLRALLGAPQDANWARLIDDMILSARIYQPFVTGQGLSVYAANLERENLMKRLFVARFREAEQREGKKPRVFFKFGGTHMARGLSSTHVPSLGNFVQDFAEAEGLSTYHVMLLCGPGTKAGDLMGNPADCSIDLATAFPDLAGQVDVKNPTLFDLKPWKDKPRRWAHLPEETRNLIWAFDALLFVPNGKPAQGFK